MAHVQTARRRWIGVDFPTGTHDGLRIDAKSSEQADYYERLARSAVENRLKDIAVWPDDLKVAEIGKVFAALESSFPRVYKHEGRPQSKDAMFYGLDTVH